MRIKNFELYLKTFKNFIKKTTVSIRILVLTALTNQHPNAKATYEYISSYL